MEEACRPSSCRGMRVRWRCSWQTLPAAACMNEALDPCVSVCRLPEPKCLLEGPTFPLNLKAKCCEKAIDLNYSGLVLKLITQMCAVTSAFASAVFLAGVMSSSHSHFGAKSLLHFISAELSTCRVATIMKGPCLSDTVRRLLVPRS